MDAIERPKSLTEIVLTKLRDQIIHGDLALGTALSERRIAEELRVSKTPVREALAQLKSEGLIHIYPQSGAHVITFSAAEIVDMCDYRLVVETAGLKMAMAHNHETLLEELSEIVRSMQKAHKKGATREYLEMDSAFHEAFFTNCGNKHLHDSYNLFSGKIAALRTHLAAKPGHTKLSLDEHLLMLEIVKSGDVNKGENVLVEHIGRTRDAYSLEIPDVAADDQKNETAA
jgi:DNA-binding GntR family transcriptional regulator